MSNSSILLNSSNHLVCNDKGNEKNRTMTSRVAASSRMSATRASRPSSKRQQHQHHMMAVVDDDPRRRGEAITGPLHHPLTRRQQPATGVSDHQNSSHPHSASHSSLPVIVEDQEYLERIRRFR
eukprot:CAMPEP_0119559718 /NCGR_PEP_ID=MMETSP1352-20130426/13165_1 /TAXON_ID=265584 /ORGANISM="Stauroneis constricta, Strain CCMP1120" /LENGTH=123 /DNA_ID=CAMNT_0007607495 /DNA_START=37 /DNA_END=404 /DNA_ORIENTATION=-